MPDTAEQRRLHAHRARQANWRNWGPYLAERAWGTIREDYSATGDAWGYFPHDHARSRAYRWNEDGLGGISDRHQYLCFALALWNGHDSILKERLFGLTGPQGNHGEDVKEYYFYLDNTPTHSYMKMLYKYPQRAFPYQVLIDENTRRDHHDAEYELLDTGVFDDDRYFDVFIEYAKAGPQDILARITVINRGVDAAECYVLPTVWARNTWSWGYQAGPLNDVTGKPVLYQVDSTGGARALVIEHPAAGTYYFFAEGAPDLLFTDNETDNARVFGTPNASPYVKDAFHRYVIDGEAGAVNPAHRGTKAAALYHLTVGPGEVQTLRLRLADHRPAHPFENFDSTFEQRRDEADAFYATLQPPTLSEDERRVQRQAFAGMLWSKQLYYYDVEQWLKGDPAMPAPPQAHRNGRNAGWGHLSNFDVISMPDKWEYPWYASWDLAFHCLPLVLLDPDFAKRQLTLITREWYMHPNGQFPSYEWNFDHVTPPVHAWAAWQVYKIEAQEIGQADRVFLEGMFLKLLLNFTWWVNREDQDGNNVFQGGFLGMDNISVFDRSAILPTGGHLDQSDATAWMGFYSLEMMRIALELARKEPVYQDVATKFFEHFLRIATAMTQPVGREQPLWDEDDGFFYDSLHLPDGTNIPLKVRSLVGLLPLIAVQFLDADLLAAMPDFERRMHWFIDHRPHLAGNIASIDLPGHRERRLIAILTRERLVRVLRYMLDENEFLSPYGIRSMSKVHADHPYTFYANGVPFTARYTPAESDNALFGGNSNWRGPVWFPTNYLIIEALQKFHHYYGDSLTVECPTGSGQMMTMGEVAAELSRRLIRLFLRRDDDERPVYGGVRRLQDDPLWRDYVLFYEYFNGDNGAGLGASHQTGWTGLVARLIQHWGTEG